MEIFLYDWWPIVGRRRIYERLSRMAVEVVHTGSPRQERGLRRSIQRRREPGRLDP
jgi:hypothetical protein